MPQSQPFSHSEETKPEHKPKRGRRFGYILTIIFVAVFLYVANNLIKWEAQVVTDEWTKVLGLLNVSLVLSIVAYLIFLFYEGRVFYFAARTILDIISIAVLYRLYAVFPFNFSEFFGMDWLTNVFPYVLLLGIVGTVIGVIVRTVRFLAKKNIHY